MKVLLFTGLMIATLTVQAAKWAQIDEQTLSMVGNIDSKEFDRFEAAFHSGIGRLIVDSGGGDVEQALLIAQILKSQQVDVEVQGICMSSCANYVFTAGKRRIISRGLVGYHGNLTAFLKTASKEDFVSDIIQNGGDKLYAEKTWQHLVDVVAPMEQLFLHELGISQNLFDRTQKADKGMGSGVYSVLLPKPTTFQRYGILNVEGEQSQDMIANDPRIVRAREAGEPVLHD